MRINIPSLNQLSNFSTEIAIFTVIGVNAIREAKKECSSKNIVKAGLKAITNCGIAFSTLSMHRNGLHPVTLQLLAFSVAANYVLEKIMTDSPLLAALKRNDATKVSSILRSCSTREKITLLNEKHKEKTLLNYAFLDCSDELVKAILDSPPTTDEKRKFFKNLFPLYQNDLLIGPLVKLNTMVKNGILDEETTSFLINAIWDKVASPMSPGSLIPHCLTSLLKAVYQKYPTIVKRLFSPTFTSYPRMGSGNLFILSTEEFANIFKFHTLKHSFPTEFRAHLDQISMEQKKEFFEELTPEQSVQFVRQYNKKPTPKTKCILTSLQKKISNIEHSAVVETTIAQSIRQIFSEISPLNLALAAARSRYKFVMHNALLLLGEEQLKFIVPQLNKENLVKFIKEKINFQKHIPILEACTPLQIYEYLLSPPSVETHYFPDWNEKRDNFATRLDEIKACTTEDEKNKKIYQLKRDFDEFSEKEFSTFDEAKGTVNAFHRLFTKVLRTLTDKTAAELEKNTDEFSDLIRILDTTLSKIHTRWGREGEPADSEGKSFLPEKGSLYKEYNELFPKIDGLVLKVDESFLDAITDKLMSEPYIIPDTKGQKEGSFLHIDKKNLQKLDPKKPSKGEIEYLHPYRRSRDPESAYILDTKLQKEIEAWRKPLES